MSKETWSYQVGQPTGEQIWIEELTPGVCMVAVGVVADTFEHWVGALKLTRSEAAALFLALPTVGPGPDDVCGLMVGMGGDGDQCTVSCSDRLFCAVPARYLYVALAAYLDPAREGVAV